MTRFPSLTKTRELFITHKRMAIIVVGMMVIASWISIHKNQRYAEYMEWQEKATPFVKLRSNPQKFDFILKHKFSKNGLDFKNFVQQIARQNYACIPIIDFSEEKSKIGQVNVSLAKITGFFWHDTFIFNFLDNLQDFSPGFLNITYVEIDKFTKQLGAKPILKLEVICKIFQK